MRRWERCAGSRTGWTNHASSLKSAVALDRNNAHALLQLGETLMFLGRPADAIPEIEHSIRLNPRDPNAAFGDWALGTCHLLLGHTDEAADLLLRTRAGILGSPTSISTSPVPLAFAATSMRHVRHLRTRSDSAGGHLLDPMERSTAVGRQSRIDGAAREYAGRWPAPCRDADRLIGTTEASADPVSILTTRAGVGPGVW